MFLTSAAFAKATRVLVNTLSTAGTGTHLLYKRDRLASKAVILRFDKAVGQKVLFVETHKIKSLQGSKR